MSGSSQSSWDVFKNSNLANNTVNSVNYYVGSGQIERIQETASAAANQFGSSLNKMKTNIGKNIQSAAETAGKALLDNIDPEIEIDKIDKVSGILIGFFFFLLTLYVVFYLIFGDVIDYKSNTIKSRGLMRFGVMLTVVYFMVFWIHYIINKTKATAFMFWRTFYIVITVFLVISGSTYLTLEMGDTKYIPNLTSIFSNTIGYLFLTIFYSQKIKDATSIFKSRKFENFTIPFEILITKLPEDKKEFDAFIASMKTIEETDVYTPIQSDFYIDTIDREHNTKVEYLYDLVNTKRLMGQMVWMFLSSFTTLLVSLVALNKNIF